MMAIWMLALGVAFGVAGCEEKGPLEEAGERMDDALDEAGDAVEDAGEEVKDAVDN
jgi:hypothetical protein